MRTKTPAVAVPPVSIYLRGELPPYGALSADEALRQAGLTVHRRQASFGPAAKAAEGQVLAAAQGVIYCVSREDLEVRTLDEIVAEIDELCAARDNNRVDVYLSADLSSMTSRQLTLHDQLGDVSEWRPWCMWDNAENLWRALTTVRF